MTKLAWDSPGERYYENGVDRGVLYIEDFGYAWSGLTSVSESPSGGEPRPFYIDGVKFRNLASLEEYEATITAFASPPEFGECDGVASIQNGLFVTQQPRKPFDLSYRTGIGSDTDEDLGYKIHIVYNALASPSEKANNTVNESVEPMSMSWKITATPPTLVGYKPTAHFVVDSRFTPSGMLEEVEEALYGTEVTSSYLPTVGDLIGIFTA